MTYWRPGHWFSIMYLLQLNGPIQFAHLYRELTMALRFTIRFDRARMNV